MSTDEMGVQVLVADAKRWLLKQILVLYAVLGLAAILLFLAGFIGIAFTRQTFFWSFVTLYSLYLIMLGFNSLRRGKHNGIPATTPQPGGDAPVAVSSGAVDNGQTKGSAASAPCRHPLMGTR